MARIRTVKPEFFTDSKILTLSDSCALFYIGLWNFCDDEGKHQNNPLQLSAEMGGRWKQDKIKKFISLLSASGQLRLSLCSDWLQVVQWSHQRIDRVRQPKVKASEIRWVEESDSTMNRDPFVEASSHVLDRRVSETYIHPDTKRPNPRKIFDVKEVEIDACVNIWGLALEKFGATRDPKTDKFKIARLLQDNGYEQTKYALIGYPLEAKTDSFDPAKNVSISRLFKQHIFDKLANLGSMTVIKKREYHDIVIPTSE